MVGSNARFISQHLKAIFTFATQADALGIKRKLSQQQVATGTNS